jgi:alcohol dehydrogenase (NADP+)
MPGIGLGTFGSDHVSADEVASAVSEALRLGYRYIDCAACYGNEKEVGGALKEAMEKGLDRSELFILSKLWNDMHEPSDVLASCKKSIEDLGVKYLGLLSRALAVPELPRAALRRGRAQSRVPAVHPRGVHAHLARDGNAGGHRAGQAHRVSNVTIPKMDLILRDARIKPAVNEMELHPCMQQGETVPVLRGSRRRAYWIQPHRVSRASERDKTPEDISDIDLPVVREIAQRHGVHPATLCVKWASQRGQVPIPFPPSAKTCSPTCAASRKTRSRPRKCTKCARARGTAASSKDRCFCGRARMPGPIVGRRRHHSRLDGIHAIIRKGRV